MRPFGRSTKRQAALANIAASALLLALLVDHARSNADAATVHAGQPVMGTILQVTITTGDRADAKRLADVAIAIARHWDDVLTTWRADGELALLNQSAGMGTVPVSPDLARALAAMKRLSRATGGAFDPAVGPIVEILRNGGVRTADDLGSIETKIETALTLTHPAHARLAAHSSLDAGGIGKGIALDAIAQRLRQEGVDSAFLDFGGSSQLAIGRPGIGEDWKMVLSGLQEGQVLGVLPVSAAALSTSRADDPHNPAGAIVDPRTRKAITRPRLATVLADDATTAEAWSTALIVLGPGGLEAAHAAGVEALVQDAAGVHRTAGFPLQTAVLP